MTVRYDLGGGRGGGGVCVMKQTSIFVSDCLLWGKQPGKSGIVVTFDQAELGKEVQRVAHYKLIQIKLCLCLKGQNEGVGSLVGNGGGV